MNKNNLLKVYFRTLLLGCALLVPSANNVPKAEAKSPLGVPNIYELTILVNETLTALNNANRTGNYSVLRDLGSKSFKRLNSKAQLAKIFAGQRNRQLDISAALLYSPVFTSPPKINQKGLLHLKGHIPTEPFHLKFVLIFDKSKHHWQIVTLSIAPAIKPPQTFARR